MHNSKGKKIWDTGMVKDQAEAFIPYTGPDLVSRERYTARIIVWDNHGACAEEVCSFETGLLHPEDWEADWVAPGLEKKRSKPGFGNQAPATMFRNCWSLQEKPVLARVYATCHGMYRLYLNGTDCTVGRMAPEHTMYAKYLCYQVADVTALLKKGINRLEMYVADGWMLGAQSHADIPDMDENHCALYQLELTFSDGRTETVLSGNETSWSEGPVRSADLYAGELYDANALVSDWKPCSIRHFGMQNLRAECGGTVEEAVVLPVREVLHTPKGETLLDFGQVLAGRVRMKVHAAKGTRITLEHCEALDREGNFFNNISGQKGVGDGVDQKDVFIASGKDEVYEPLFTFHGFRYVRISGLQQVNPEDYCAVVLSSEMNNLCDFSCSNQKINRLYQNTRWSERSNMLSIPTDCPQREKAGWTGDIQIYSRTALQNADLTVFLTRWLDNLVEEQDKDGKVPIVVPYDGPYPGLGQYLGKLFGTKGKLTSAGWSDAAVLVPYQMYQVTGNRWILQRQYPSMKKWCDYIIRTAHEKTNPGSDLPEQIQRKMWNTGFHWGEWLIPSLEKNEDGKKRSMETGPAYIAPIFGWLTVSVMQETAQILGNKADADHYREEAFSMKRAIAESIHAQGDLPVFRWMGAYVLLLYFDLVPPEAQKAFADKLVSMIENNENCLDTGFLATPYLLDACCKIGRLDLAYKILYQERCPSWLYEVVNGATTIWENWYSFRDGNPTNTSMNHYAFGCVDDWIYRKIGGIRPAESGFRKIIFNPEPDESLTEAELSLNTIHGIASCHWKKKENGEFTMNVTVPCNTSARIILPDHSEYTVGSGTYEYHIHI
ncbi:MAG: family 78 glycoside hydrolase catalytic domain [Bilifractor sp.]